MIFVKKSNNFQKFFLISFVGIVALWAYLALSHKTSGTINYWYSFLFGLIPLFGGLVGVFKSRVWGGLKSHLGKAVFFVSLGLLLWGLGEAIWSYYNFFKHVPAPYPSLADLGFAPSIFFWILGTLYLSVATGAMLALKRNTRAKVLAIVIPLVLLVPSYYIQVVVARGGTLIPEGETALKMLLDVAYPFGDFLALTLAATTAILSYKYFGGIYRLAVFSLLAGLAVMYAADSVFSYTTTEGTYYNGNWGDLLLATGQFLMTYGILAFATKPSLVRNEANSEPSD